MRLDVGQLCGNTKVGELDLADLGKENIGRLDVSVNLAFGVQVFETAQKLAADDGDVAFGEVVWFELSPSVQEVKREEIHNM